MINRISIAFVTGVMFFAGATSSAVAKPGFPRLGGVQNGSPFNYNDPAYQKQLARLDMTVLGMYPGLKPGGMSMNQVVSNIKSINPNTLVFLYVSANELGSSSVTGPAWDAVRAKMNAMNWWLHSSGRSGPIVASSYGANYQTINTTAFVPNDASGNDAMEWMTRFFVDNYYKPNPSIDGFFMDNVFWKTRVAGDWNLSGSTESAGDTNASAWLRQSYRRYFDLVKSLMPGKLQIGNIADLGDPKAVAPELQGAMGGGVIEGLMGASYSVETWGTWSQMMAWYRKSMAISAEPKLVVFNQKGSATDYQGLRYGLASCLMDDGYFAYTDSSKGYYGVTWFDEFDANLGQATSSPSTSAWQNGVYRRDFENGIALVNPKGNGTVTVTLEQDYWRLSGKQAPSVNNGQVTRTVTLKDRDGIILLRSAGGSPSVSTARPAAPQSVVVE